MHWRVLGVSLAASILLAFLLVEALVKLGLRDQLNLLVPLLPIVYALVYPTIDRSGAPALLSDTARRPAPPSYALRAGARPGARWSGRLTPVLWGLGASLAAYLLLELAAWLAYRRFAQELPLPDWRQANFLDASRWFRGDLITLDGWLEIVYSVAEMLVVGAAGGTAVGLTSRGDPLLEGVITGSVAAMGMSVNQFFVAYEELSRRFGYGMALLLLLQTFLFALWAGTVSRARTRR